MSKGGVLKSSWVIVNPADTRVIDSNAIAETRIKEMTTKLAEQSGESVDFDDGFVQGLNAVDVSELVHNNEIYASEDDYQLNLDSVPTQQVQSSVSVAESLIAEAQAQIEAMKTEALAEIEQAKVMAIEEGRNEGYQEGIELGRKEGYEQGHREALDGLALQREEIVRESKIKIQEIEKEYNKKINELEPKFIETLTGIYEHIFNVSLKKFRGLIVHLVQNTMKNIEGNTSYLIHVSKEDYPFASMQKNELVKGTSISVDSVEVIEDVTLGRNECMIETGNGVFDCGLGTQLEALKEELKLLSYEPE